jgi:hypothetical protein
MGGNAMKAGKAPYAFDRVVTIQMAIGLLHRHCAIAMVYFGPMVYFVPYICNHPFN